MQTSTKLLSLNTTTVLDNFITQPVTVQKALVYAGAFFVCILMVLAADRCHACLVVALFSTPALFILSALFNPRPLALFSFGKDSCKSQRRGPLGRIMVGIKREERRRDE